MIELMLDSGAYSAHTVGASVCIREYMKFIERHRKQIRHIINLDVIPSSPAHVEDAAKQSWTNFLKLRKAGHHPMPVYHFGERRYWLDKMLGEGVPYIGLGGVAKVKDAERRDWLDSTFAYLCGTRSYPAVAVHGFGITSVPLLFRYPWRSVDSTAWVIKPGMGLVFIPPPIRGKLGTYDYNARPYLVYVSSEGRGKGYDQASNHLDGLGPELRAHVDAWLNDVAGFTIPDVQSSLRNRRVACSRYLLNVEQGHVFKPFAHYPSGLVHERTPHKGSDFQPHDFDVIFSTKFASTDMEATTSAGVTRWLLSFHYIRNIPVDELAYCVKTGLKRPKVTA